MANNTEPGLVDSNTISEWKDNLENFKNIVYPKIYQPYGFTLPEAFHSWQLNLIRNSIIDVEEKIEGNSNSWD